jgi:hypothetical protein
MARPFSITFPRASDGPLTRNPTYSRQDVSDGETQGKWLYQSQVNAQGLVKQRAGRLGAAIVFHR